MQLVEHQIPKNEMEWELKVVVKLGIINSKDCEDIELGHIPPSRSNGKMLYLK